MQNGAEKIVLLIEDDDDDENDCCKTNADNLQNDRPCEKESADSISNLWLSFLGQCVHPANQGQHQLIFAIDLTSNSINEAELIQK